MASTASRQSGVGVDPEACVVALLLGVTLGHEIVSAWEWLSAGIILVGVVILFVRRRG